MSVHGRDVGPGRCVTAGRERLRCIPMDITRDVFVTDARAPYFMLTLASRDLEAHSILSSLTPGEHEQIADALTTAASAVVDVLRAAHAREAQEGKTSFGCGT